MTAPRATDHAVERMADRFGIQGTKAQLEAVLAEIDAVRAGAIIHAKTDHRWTVTLRDHDITLCFRGPVLVTVTRASEHKQYVRRRQSLRRCHKARPTDGRAKKGHRRPEHHPIEMED